MKRKLLSLTAALLCAVGMWAQASYNHTYTSGVEVAAGNDYFLYNIGAGQFLTNGLQYGTMATVDNSGRVLTLAKTTNGFSIYTDYVSFNNRTTRKNGYLTTNGFVDTGTNDADWVFTPVSVAGYTNAYTIKNSETQYLYYNPSDADYACKISVGSNTSDNNSYWLLIPKTTRESAGDYSHYIINSQMNAAWEFKTWGGSEGWEDTSVITVGGKVTNRCAEKYHAVKDIYQTINETLPNGLYRLYVQGFWRQDGSAAGPVLYANTNTKTLSVITGTENDMNDASDSFTAGSYVNYVETLVSNGTLCVGINITDNNQWVIFDNFVLDYRGNNVEYYSPTSFTSNTGVTAATWYEFTVASAGWYRINSSADATLYYTQNNSDDADATASKALTAGTNTIINLTAGSFFFKSSNASTIKIEAANGVLQDGDDVTMLITNPSFETGNKTGWTDDTASDGSDDGKDDKIDVLSSDALSGKDGTYFAERWWHNSNMDIYQTTPTIPAGFYRITARAKAESGNDIKIYAKAGSSDEVTTSVSDATDYSVEVYLSSAGSVKLGLKGHHITKTHVAFDNFRLTFWGNPYPALKDAIDDAEANYKLGFENGEYAPYNNKDALTALANANSIYDAKTATAAEVGEATTTLTGATWTANNGEVECVYNGDFSIGQESPAANIQQYGWTRTNDWGQFRNDGYNSSTAYYNQPGSMVYGNTGVYTMPLKANTTYTLTFKYASWEANSNDGIKASVLNSSDGMSEKSYGENNTVYNEENAYATITEKFVTGAAGNYVLTLTNSGNTVITDVSIKKTTATVLDEDISYTPVAGPANVTLKRTIKANKWNTFCVPFDMEKSELGASAEVKKLTGASKNGDNYTLTFGDATSIEAGKPYMVKVPSEVTSISLTGKTISSTITPTEVGDVTFTGVYTSGKAPLNSFIISDNAFYMVDQENTVNLKAFRGYITVGSGSSVKALNFVFDDDPDGISTIENGQLTIDNAPIYNLAGQRIQKMQKGINIVNGKKIMK